MQRSNFTYDELKKIAVEHRNKPFLNEETGQIFRPRLSHSFLYLTHTEFVKEGILAIKCHFNFGSMDQIKKAWDSIIPILLANPELFQSIKVADFAAMKKRNEDAIRKIDAIDIPNAKHKIKDTDQLVIKLNDLDALKKYYLDELKRYFAGGAVTFYLYNNKDGKFDANAVLKLTDKVADALEKAGIKPGPALDTDFCLKNNKYVTVRLDTRNNVYLDVNKIFLPENWHAAKNDKNLQALVLDEKELNKPRPAFVPRPFTLRADELQKTLKPETVKDFLQIVNNIIEMINKQYRKKLSVVQMEGFLQIERFLSFRSMITFEKWAGILNQAEIVISKTWEEKQVVDTKKEEKIEDISADAFFKAVNKTKSASQIMDKFFRTLASFDETEPGIILIELNKLNLALQKSSATESTPRVSPPGS